MRNSSVPVNLSRSLCKNGSNEENIIWKVSVLHLVRSWFIDVYHYISVQQIMWIIGNILWNPHSLHIVLSILLLLLLLQVIQRTSNTHVVCRPMCVCVCVCECCCCCSTIECFSVRQKNIQQDTQIPEQNITLPRAQQWTLVNYWLAVNI